MDDLSISGLNVNFDYNVDYMEKEIDEYDLYRCWRINNSVTIKLHNEDISTIIPSSVSKRLENVCWRRWYKDMNQLSVVSPSTINWYKDQDITWLYGPKFTDGRSFEVPQSPSSSPLLSADDFHNNEISIQVEEEDSASISSTSTPIEITPKFKSDTNSNDEGFLSSSPESCISEYSLSKSSSLSSMTSIDDVQDRKNINKNKNNNENNNDKQECYNLKLAFKLLDNSCKRVKFNYIVNSREFVNGLSVDYLFLDHQCL